MLGVTSPGRLVDQPSIPVIAELLPGYAIAGWIAVLVPKGTLAAVVTKINTDMKEILNNSDVLTRLQGLGVYPDLVNLGTPESLMQFVKHDSALMESLVKAAGIKREGEAPN